MLISVKMSIKERKYSIQINIMNVPTYDWEVESCSVFDRRAAFRFGCGFIFCLRRWGTGCESESVGCCPLDVVAIIFGFVISVLRDVSLTFSMLDADVSVDDVLFIGLFGCCLVPSIFI